MIFKSHRRMKNTTLSRMILAVWSSAIRECKTRLLYIEKAEALKAQYNRSCHVEISKNLFLTGIIQQFSDECDGEFDLIATFTYIFICHIKSHHYIHDRNVHYHGIQIKVHHHIICKVWYISIVCSHYEYDLCLFHVLHVNDGMQRYVFHHIYQSLLF
jgi:hypothetical protein